MATRGFIAAQTILPGVSLWRGIAGILTPGGVRVRRFIWKCLGTVTAVIASAYLLPGVRFSHWINAAAVGVLLAAAYVLFRPVARILLGVFNLITLGMVGVIIDAGLFYACAMKIDGFAVDSFAWALAAAVLVDSARLMFGMAGKINRA
jgi:uncharacterized membrane protein YvlD (DUF360 family)